MFVGYLLWDAWAGFVVFLRGPLLNHNHVETPNILDRPRHRCPSLRRAAPLVARWRRSNHSPRGHRPTTR